MAADVGLGPARLRALDDQQAAGERGVGTTVRQQYLRVL
jgi:hypothetical protein